MLVSDLADTCALMLGDSLFAQITKPQWLLLIQSASKDLDAAGWLLRVSDDTSVVVVPNTFDYAIPQPFAYIKELRAEEIQTGISVYTRLVPRSHWEPHLQSGVPVLHFWTLSSLEAGRKLMIIGQQRPTQYATLGDTIDVGMEAFLRERAIAYGARLLGGDTSEYAHWRQVIAGQAMQASEATKRLLPQEFRMLPDSVVVPTREA